MKQFRSFILKEFRHILRDKRSLLLIFAMPMVLVILFGFAISTEVKDARIAVLDNSHDELTLGLINRLVSSGYFIESVRLHANSDVQEVFKEGLIKLAVVFESGFAENFYTEGSAKIQLIADASDLNTATSLLNYASGIIRDYREEITRSAGSPAPFETTVKMLYNPEQKGVFMFVPGVLALILMLVSAMMTAVSITREKEMGTMRVLTVSPLRPLSIIAGKVIPYLFLSLINTLLILALSMFLFGMPIMGSAFLLFLVCFIFLTTCMSLGILISAFAETQQVALIISQMGLFLPTVLLSGFIYPIENMPLILQGLCQPFPAKWFIEAIKSVMIKGSGFGGVWLQLTVLVSMTLLFVIISAARFQRRLR